MAAVGNRTGQLVTVDTLAGWTPAQRQAYLASIDPAHAQTAQKQVVQARAIANADYLARSVRHLAVCPPTSGGLSASYSAGSTLVYNLPNAQGAFAKNLIVVLDLTITPATGTSAAYAWNAAGPLALLSEARVTLGGTVQHRMRPYAEEYFARMRRYLGAKDGDSLAGDNVASIGTALDSGTPAITGGTPITYTRYFRIPMASLHDHSPAGMIPIMGSNTPGQVAIDCATAAMGPDPILNAIAAAGGSGNAVTVTGTVQVLCEYFDGQNFDSPNPLGLDLSGEPTAQYIIDTPLSPLQTGNVQRQKISSLLKHYMALAVVVDGNQSTKFAANSNITTFELDKDSVGQNKFFAFGNGTNLSMNAWFEYVRRTYGQDFDEGVFPIINASGYGQQNPSNRMGTQVLNMMAGGWTDVHHGWQVTSVGGVAGITPRVELYLVSLNPSGLVAG